MFGAESTPAGASLVCISVPVSAMAGGAGVSAAVVPKRTASDGSAVAAVPIISTSPLVLSLLFASASSSAWRFASSLTVASARSLVLAFSRSAAFARSSASLAVVSAP
ncbi:hypothetical protein B0H11DRAFT_1981105 [Mycena galericulata]|nr:hypothetical protein B0H11DRAFT_1981105 [Mycena galericulata]